MSVHAAADQTKHLQDWVGQRACDTERASGGTSSIAAATLSTTKLSDELMVNVKLKPEPR